MIKCKDYESSSCGKQCCCHSCDDKDICQNVCPLYKDIMKEGHKTPIGECDEAEEIEIVKLENQVPDVIKAITDICTQKKKLEAEEKEMKKQLQKAMETYNVKSYEDDNVKFTYVASGTRTTIDSTKLKKELPDIAEKYSKTSNVSASVRITVK